MAVLLLEKAPEPLGGHGGCDGRRVEARARDGDGILVEVGPEYLHVEVALGLLHELGNTSRWSRPLPRSRTPAPTPARHTLALAIEEQGQHLMLSGHRTPRDP